MPVIKNIIFDFGAIIFDIKHSLTIDAFKKLGIPDVEGIFGHLKQSNLFDDFETGKISTAEFRDGLRKLAGKELSDAQIDDAWNALLIGIPAGKLELLTQLKNRYSTFLLSNTNELHYNWIFNYLKKDLNTGPMMANYFIKEYYSHLVKLRKPNVDIFEFVLNNHQLIPEETLFIDDTPQHVATAAKLGMQTIHLLSIDSLEQELTKKLNA